MLHRGHRPLYMGVIDSLRKANGITPTSKRYFPTMLINLHRPTKTLSQKLLTTLMGTVLSRILTCVLMLALLLPISLASMSMSALPLAHIMLSIFSLTLLLRAESTLGISSPLAINTPFLDSIGTLFHHPLL